jgi:hypothetical protein
MGDGGAVSNPAVVAHWLGRLEPFASLPVSPLEPFRAVEPTGTNWEVVPEFFCEPEFLLANATAGGRHFDDVKLLRWASDAPEFVYVHRKAIESEFVSLHLHEWINLVFGVVSATQLPVTLFDSPHPSGQNVFPISRISRCGRFRLRNVRFLQAHLFRRMGKKANF